MSMKKDHVLSLALDVWGFNIQSLVLVEEMSELTKEIIKVQRDSYFKKDVDFTEMIREMADVQLMLDQIKHSLNDKERDLFQKEYGRKLNRVKKWLLEECD